MSSNNAELIKKVSDEICGNLANFPGLSAYPQMAHLPYLISNGFNRLTDLMVQLEVEEKIYGEEPWAKLYHLQTQRYHGVPRGLGIIEKVVPSANNYYPTDIHIGSVINYLVASVGHSKIYRYDATPGVYVFIQLRKDERAAVISFEDNDVTITIPDVDALYATVEGPLFQHPYPVTLNPVWMKEHITDFLYKQLVTSTAPVSVDSFFNHKLNDPDKSTVFKENYDRLFEILQSGEWGSTATDLSWKDRFTVTIQYSARNYCLDIFVVRDKVTGEVIERWRSANPVLLNDLYNDLDDLMADAVNPMLLNDLYNDPDALIIEDALRIHENKEVPNGTS